MGDPQFTEPSSKTNRSVAERTTRGNTAVMSVGIGARDDGAEDSVSAQAHSPPVALPGRGALETGNLLRRNEHYSNSRRKVGCASAIPPGSPRAFELLAGSASGLPASYVCLGFELIGTASHATMEEHEAADLDIMFGHLKN
jgi:hypothetical protein